MSELYKAIAGSPITYLAGDISAGQTTIAVADDTALPDAPNICTIGYGEHIETIRYGAKSNGVLQNVTRGIEGTPRAWPAGTEVARFFTAYDHNSIIENFNSHQADYETHKADTVSDNVHGLKSVLDKKFDIGEYPQNSTYGYLSYSGDVNLLLRYGTYFVTAANVTNLPIQHNGWLKVMCQSGNYGLQEYIPQHSTGLVDTYRRFLNAGTWGAWQKI
jgi:hypothetical protein